MDRGFYNEADGYVQTSGDAQDAAIAAILGDYVEVPLKPSGNHEWNGTEWAEVLPDPAEQLAAERATMSCTRRQGLLAVGPALWQQALSLLADMQADPDIDPATVWALEVAIHHAQQWDRLNEDMQALGWLLNLTDEQLDDLFRLAVTL